MASLNFKTLQRPTLDLEFLDGPHPVIRVCYPTVDMIEELQTMDLDVLKKGDRESVRESYEFAAKLISNNRDFFKVTGEELEKTYKLEFYDLILFFKAYMAYIDGVVAENEKN